jgi:hypothetical protein
MEIPYTLNARPDTGLYNGKLFRWPGQLVVRVREAHKRQPLN